MLKLSPPQHPFEVRINIGGDTWDYVLRTLDELAEHIREHGPECSLCSGGGGGSHSVHIAKREVTPEQFHEELHAWVCAEKAATEGGRA